VNGGQTTEKYIYAGDQIIAEYNGDGFLVRKFVYGTGIDEIVRMSNCLLSADIIKNSIVDFSDFAAFANIWLLDANDAGFDPNADLVLDNVIDWQDSGAFADSWLTDGRRSEDYYYYLDGLGSVITMTNSQGRIVESCSYDIYGRVDSSSSIGNPYLFTGR
jgi:hypothetical protein